MTNKQVFEPGETITYTLRLINSGSVGTNVRYTITLPSEVVTPSGALSGTVFVNAGATVTPAVVVAQVRAGLARGTTFQAQAAIDDAYHPVYGLSFPATAIHAFYTHLPLVLNKYPETTIIIDHTTTDISRIPPYWIDQAKQLLRLSYGHTSHGSQLVSGLDALQLSTRSTASTPAARWKPACCHWTTIAPAAISAIPIAPRGPVRRAPT